MMQPGLHIGLAAWIHAQCTSTGFPTYSSTPSQTNPQDLEPVNTSLDPSKSSEFSNLVNFVPRLGRSISDSNLDDKLWKVHRSILGSMDFAVKPWNASEQENFERARGLLYENSGDGQLIPSKQLLVYDELRLCYEALFRGGGSQEEISRAMTDWIVRGNKLSIDDALETITRLSRRSSRVACAYESAALSDNPPGVALRFFNEMEFAPTFFTPPSAIDKRTWLNVNVSLSELHSAVTQVQPNEAWAAFLGNKAGQVKFSFTCLRCVRPWFTASLYGATDWRLAQQEHVSVGNGVDGLLPAYVEQVYLASVKGFVLSAAVSSSSSGDENRTTPRSVKGRDSFPVGLSFPREGVVGSAAPTRTQAGATSRVVQISAGLRRAGVPVQRSTMVLSPDALNRRRHFAELNGAAALIRAPFPASPIEVDYAAYIVGFGCSVIASAPHPNPTYQW